MDNNTNTQMKGMEELFAIMSSDEFFGWDKPKQRKVLIDRKNDNYRQFLTIEEETDGNDNHRAGLFLLKFPLSVSDINVAGDEDEALGRTLELHNKWVQIQMEQAVIDRFLIEEVEWQSKEHMMIEDFYHNVETSLKRFLIESDGLAMPLQRLFDLMIKFSLRGNTFAGIFSTISAEEREAMSNNQGGQKMARLKNTHQSFLLYREQFLVDFANLTENPLVCLEMIEDLSNVDNNDTDRKNAITLLIKAHTYDRCKTMRIWDAIDNFLDGVVEGLRCDFPFDNDVPLGFEDSRILSQMAELSRLAVERYDAAQIRLRGEMEEQEDQDDSGSEEYSTEDVGASTEASQTLSHGPQELH